MITSYQVVNSGLIAGPPGLSAYEIARQAGYTGTIEQWLASLVGPQGPSGVAGALITIGFASPATIEAGTDTIQPINSAGLAAALLPLLTALIASLPTTQPSTPGLLWLNGTSADGYTLART